MARTGPDAGAAGLAARAFRKPLSCSRAVSLDYLETRKDIDSTKLAYLGDSHGA